MRKAILTLLLVALLPAGAALARDHHVSVGSCEVREPLELGARHDLRRARFSMLTGDHAAALVLTRDVVAVQLSDRTLGKLDREFARERHEDDEDGFLASIIKSAVLGSVRAMLDHSLECPIDKLRDARYRDGRLELITVDGERIFDDLKIDDREALESFSDSDARAFVQEFHRLKGQER